MCDIGLNAKNFNPTILYFGKVKRSIESNNLFHKHDWIELKYILSGSCTYIINGENYSVHEGDIVICNSGVEHGKGFSHDEELYEINLAIDNLFIKNLRKNCLISDQTSPILTLPKYGQEFLRCCSDIIIEHEKNEPGKDLLLKASVMKLIAIILKENYMIEAREANESLSFESSEKTHIVETLISYMNNNYMYNLSLDKLSKNMYISPVYLSKIFKEETGDSPINYLIKIRLSKARELLQDKKLTIKEVSKLVGYPDAYHFSKQFKKFYDTSPSKS